MTKYRLNKAEKVPITINMVAKTKKINGRDVVTYSNYMRLVPGVEYKTDDEAMVNFFRNYKVKIRYNAETERALLQNKVPYDIEMCKSCGGRIKKISYHPVEVL